MLFNNFYAQLQDFVIKSLKTAVFYPLADNAFFKRFIPSQYCYFLDRNKNMGYTLDGTSFESFIKSSAWFKEYSMRYQLARPT